MRWKVKVRALIERRVTHGSNCVSTSRYVGAKLSVSWGSYGCMEGAKIDLEDIDPSVREKEQYELDLNYDEGKRWRALFAPSHM